MGQSALGLLYGCEEPDIPHDPKDKEFFYDLAEEFNGAGADWRKPKLRVRCESEGGKSLVGVWVSVGGSGEDGVPYFAEEAVPIGQIETAYAKDIAKAKKAVGQVRRAHGPEICRRVARRNALADAVRGRVARPRLTPWPLP